MAGAWSRSKLPPAELDVMFRSVEGVYKANRSLHSVRRSLKLLNVINSFTEIERYRDKSESIGGPSYAMGLSDTH